MPSSPDTPRTLSLLLSRRQDDDAAIWAHTKKSYGFFRKFFFSAKKKTKKNKKMAASSSSSSSTSIGERKTTIDDYYASKDLSGCLPNEIVKGLYLGSASDARNKYGLSALCIKHIVTVEMANRPPYPNDFNYLVVPVVDVDHFDVRRHFAATNSFIDDAIDSSGGAVLVHCSSGISASAAVVMAYLMYSSTMSFVEAHAHVVKRHPIAWPNEGFQQQLQQYEFELLEQRELELQLAASVESAAAEKKMLESTN
jgi:protein-tyrosine phosphatase